jgi:UDP-glucose 4-epimerase
MVKPAIMKKYATILVTGGAGYVGRHVVRALLNALHFPVVLDNSMPSCRLKLPGCAQVKGSINDRKLLTSLFTQFDFDAVIHLAACTEGLSVAADPARYHQNNFSATMVLLESMFNFGVRRLIFSSSSSVYGQPKSTPMDERHPCHPTTRHGESKYFIEKVLHDCSLTCGLRSIIFRHYAVTGYNISCNGKIRHPSKNDILTNAIAVASGGAPVFNIYGTDYGTPDGTCVRDYVHVDDVAGAYLAAVGSLMNGGRSAVYNIGTGNGYSVRELLETVRKVTKRTICEAPSSRRSGDVAALVADAARIRAELAWRPQFTDLESIIRSAWAWHQDKPTLN